MLCVVQCICLAKLPSIFISQAKRAEIIQEYAAQYYVDLSNERYRDFLQSAATRSGDWILRHTQGAEKLYQSNVLRAALEIARKVQGEKSDLFKRIQIMLSYK